MLIFNTKTQTSNLICYYIKLHYENILTMHCNPTLFNKVASVISIKKAIAAVWCAWERKLQSLEQWLFEQTMHQHFLDQTEFYPEYEQNQAAAM